MPSQTTEDVEPQQSQRRNASGVSIFGQTPALIQIFPLACYNKGEMFSVGLHSSSSLHLKRCRTLVGGKVLSKKKINDDVGNHEDLMGNVGGRQVRLAGGKTIYLYRRSVRLYRYILSCQRTGYC
jgi:hypothetical protein